MQAGRAGKDSGSSRATCVTCHFRLAMYFFIRSLESFLASMFLVSFMSHGCCRHCVQFRRFLMVERHQRVSERRTYTDTSGQTANGGGAGCVAPVSIHVGQSSQLLPSGLCTKLRNTVLSTVFPSIWVDPEMLSARRLNHDGVGVAGHTCPGMAETTAQDGVVLLATWGPVSLQLEEGEVKYKDETCAIHSPLSLVVRLSHISTSCGNP